jgi:hypothetical protein
VLSGRTAAFGSASIAVAAGRTGSLGGMPLPAVASRSSPPCPDPEASRPVGARGRRRRRCRRSAIPAGTLSVDVFAASRSVAAAVPPPASGLLEIAAAGRRRRRRRLPGGRGGLGAVSSAGAVGVTTDGSRPIGSPSGSSEECGTGRFLGGRNSVILAHPARRSSGDQWVDRCRRDDRRCDPVPQIGQGPIGQGRRRRVVSTEWQATREVVNSTIAGARTLSH